MIPIALPHTLAWPIRTSFSVLFSEDQRRNFRRPAAMKALDLDESLVALTLTRATRQRLEKLFVN
jgi:hypothetical protein